ncbi:hypothetical protein Vadar_009146 [Vaccinium darrowii]|uniref:Uncharacterized protein n=1 Tax=Vaccinium darrowii TaxID=229202 RepID=A0ACB7Z3J5_9ERIC|nr:hypothetical protein Vadar_009146 [Vaccinium darrowii]
MDSSNQNTSTKDICRSCLIERVLPAIQSKWPRCNATDPIYIQQEKARPHINPSDLAFVEAATKDRFDLRLSYQPPQSPDMNVLDLGYFRAIPLQHQEAPKSIDELVYAVEKSFEELSSDSLNRVFLSWQACMIEDAGSPAKLLLSSPSRNGFPVNVALHIWTVYFSCEACPLRLDRVDVAVSRQGSNLDDDEKNANHSAIGAVSSSFRVGGNEGTSGLEIEFLLASIYQVVELFYCMLIG